jgi:aspartate racemase
MVVEAGPPRRLLHLYGPTENATFTSWYPVKNISADGRTIPIGKPIANTTIYLLDRALQPVPVGVPGELFIGGDGLALGYLNRPELTAEKFIPDPFSKEPGARLYKTGDFAQYLPDGNIEFLGRIDLQVKIRGFRIELGEIEAVLGQHPAVREAAVIARGDQPRNASLVAYVVLKEKSSITSDKLRKLLKEKLPDHMVPSAFVVLDSLPLTPTGKVDRRALPIPDHFMPGLAKTFVAPRNGLESQLTEIWKKVLGLERIGITDNFFELGGHSLLAVRLASEIKKVARKKFSVMAIFQFPTIEQLAETIHREDWSAQKSPLVTIHLGGSKTPLFWVYDTCQARYMEPDRPLYILTHPNHDENIALYTTVEKIAIANLREMRSVQPEGPYFLGGYCFWGVVALEMAQQLVTQGEEVALLCLVEPSPLPNIVQRDNSFKSRVFRHSRNLSSLKGKEKITYLLKKLSLLFPMIKGQVDKKVIINRVKNALFKAYLFCRRPVPLPLRNFYLYNTHATELLRSYTWRSYPGRVLIFQAEKRLRGGIQTDWNELVTGEIELHEVPGAEHLSIIYEPSYMKAWVEQLSISLNDVETKNKGKKV